MESVNIEKFEIKVENQQLADSENVGFQSRLNGHSSNTIE
jgi:hypothetical protein